MRFALPFTCPVCRTPGSLDVMLAIELPPDSRSDEITLQVAGCSRCGMRGLAVYEESRRGRLDSECFDHTGYLAPASTVDAVAQTIQACPDAGNRMCPCQAHRQLGKADPAGQWDGVGGFEQMVPFRMDFSVRQDFPGRVDYSG